MGAAQNEEAAEPESDSRARAARTTMTSQPEQQEAETVRCHRHGVRRKAYVCDHLLTGRRQGFVSSNEQPGNPYPDAWCSACDHIRKTHGRTWNSESEALITVRLVCGDCYEEIVAMTPYYYALESRVDGRDRWREVADWETDDPIPIPKEQVLFVGDRVACVFFRGKYVLTIDGGKTWSTWNAVRARPSLTKAIIVDVKLDQAGRGTLVMRYQTHGDHGTMTLKTTDYGVHWATTN